MESVRKKAQRISQPPENATEKLLGDRTRERKKKLALCLPSRKTARKKKEGHGRKIDRQNSSVHEARGGSATTFRRREETALASDCRSPSKRTSRSDPRGELREVGSPACTWGPLVREETLAGVFTAAAPAWCRSPAP